MYRSRSEANLGDEMLNFISSLEEDKSILHYDILGSEAHNIMLYEIGLLTIEQLSEILSALEEVKNDPSLLDVESFEDIHESLEAFVVKRTGISVGGRMQTARSRNDQVILDIRMKVRDDINEICTAIIELINAVLAKAEENKKTIMLMYTHMQQAQIGTFSHLMLSYVDALFRDIDRLYLSYGRINQSPLGACAIGGSTLKIDRRRIATLLGFDRLIINSIDATTSRDAIIEFVSALTILMTTLSRIAEDLIIWSTTEFGYVDLSDENSSSSSAMPQKKNPDPLELVRAKTSAVLGNLITIIAIVKSLPSGYSRDLQELKPQLWKASRTAEDAVWIMKNIVVSLRVYKDRMQETAKSSYAIAIDIAEQLVLRQQIPYRVAHRLIGSLIHKAITKDNLPLSKLPKEDVEETLSKLESAITVEELMKTINEMTPERSILMRTSEGSPNPDYQQEMIGLSFRKLSGYTEGVAKRKGNVKGSLDKLSKLVNDYCHTNDRYMQNKPS